MRTVFHLLAGVAGLLAVSFTDIAQPCSAQYTGVQVPLQSNTNSYFNRVGVDFGFSFPGAQNGHGVVGLMPNGQFTPDGSIRFSQGSAYSAIPPFGGYDPGGDAHLGFAKVSPGGGGWHLNVFASQGNSSSSGVVAPSMVVPNGVWGSMFHGQQTPFVTGFVPVVGAFPPSYYTTPGPSVSYVNPVAYRLANAIRERREAEQSGIELPSREEEVAPAREVETGTTKDARNSTAASGELSVAELKRQRAQRLANEEKERSAKVAAELKDGIEAAAERHYGAARSAFRRALRYANEQEKVEILRELEKVDGRQ